ncbi:MAG: DUF6265 family protein [Myxococcota bacterium]
MRPLLAIVLLMSCARVRDPGWIAGIWVAERGGKRHEENWSTAPGGLNGRGCFERDGKQTFSETMRIEVRGDGTPVFVAQPEGASSTEFPAIEQTAHRIVFENPSHDWPKRIEYWREADVLYAKASGGDRTQEWKWSLASESRCEK